MRSILLFLLPIIISAPAMALEASHDHEEPEPQEAFSLTVEVEDADGVAVEGAKVAVSGMAEGAMVTKTSDSAGVVRYSLPGGLYRVDASLPYTKYERRFVALDGDWTETVRLSPAVPVERVLIEVVDGPTGRPVPRAVVRVTGGPAIDIHIPSATVAGSDGLAWLELPGGSYVVSAVVVPMYEPAVTRITVPSAEPAVLRLRPSQENLTWIHGRVLAPNGDGIENATVRFSLAHEPQVSAISIFTDRSGRFGTWLPGNDYTIRAFKEGHFVTTVEVQRNGMGDELVVTVEPFADPQPALFITTRDEVGITVADAQVQLTAAPGTREVPVITTRTNVDGQVAVRLPTGAYDVLVRAAGFARADAAIDLEGDTQRDIVLRRPADATHNVRLAGPLAERYGGTTLYVVASDGQAASGRPGRDGSFAFSDPMQGLCLFTLMKERDLMHAEVAPCDASKIGSDGPGPVEGQWRIRLQGAEAETTATVFARHLGGAAWQEIHGRGEFVVSGPPGEYQVVVVGSSIEPRWATAVFSDASPVAGITVETSPHEWAGAAAALQALLGTEGSQSPSSYVGEVRGTKAPSLLPMVVLVFIGAFMARRRST